MLFCMGGAGNKGKGVKGKGVKDKGRKDMGVSCRFWHVKNAWIFLLQNIVKVKVENYTGL